MRFYRLLAILLLLSVVYVDAGFAAAASDSILYLGLVQVGLKVGIKP